MPIEILMPALSPTMTEGNLSKWVKKEGDKVKPGDVIAEIETDKATMEVESIDEGIIAKILIPEGTEAVKVNTLIAVLAIDNEKVEDFSSYQAAVNSESKSEPKIVEEVKKTVTEKVSSNNTGRVFASPLAKRIASDKNIDLSKILGSGPHGRIVKDDLENIKAHTNYSSPKVHVERNDEEYIKKPNNNMRKVIAKRLLESKQTIPHFYLGIECNMDKLLAIREDINQTVPSDNPEAKLSVNDFIIKACAMALHDVPEANASWTDEAILHYNNVDISVAVAIDGGLITPIVKNADHKTLFSISSEMKNLVKKARAGTLAPHEFQGGGFSISNLGMYGIKNFKAIVNPPQSCIVAVGGTTKRAVVIKDEIKIANMADFTISCDHRVVDGAVGANFLKAFTRYIENPILMFI